MSYVEKYSMYSARNSAGFRRALLSLTFLSFLVAAISAHASDDDDSDDDDDGGVDAVFECQSSYPNDHEGLQSLLDSVTPGSKVRVKGVCEFEPDDPNLPRGSVSLMQDGLTLKGPATIHGGETPVLIGFKGPTEAANSPNAAASLCSDANVTCTQVQGAAVRKLEFVSPTRFAIGIRAGSGDIEIAKNTVHPPRIQIVDFERVGAPFAEPFSACIVVDPTANTDLANDLRFGPDIVTGEISISNNTCLGDAAITDETDADGVLDPFVGQYVKGAYRGIYVVNVNADVSIRKNHVENTFRPSISVNADSPLFSPRAESLRVDIRSNTVIQDAPGIVAAGFFPTGILCAIDPNVNSGPHAVRQNTVYIDDQFVGLGAGVEARGLSNVEIKRNDVNIAGNGAASFAIGVVGSRQGPSGPGVVTKNTLSGNTTVGIIVGDGAPLFGNPPGLFGITSHIEIKKNDISGLTTGFFDMLFQSDSQLSTYRGKVGENVGDFGVDNEVILE